MGFNCLALAILETESRLLAEGFMTTHNHCLFQTDDYAAVMYKSRIAYSRYFNNKYGRKGRLGEKRYFYLEVDGTHHTTAALNYVLRQGLHHGLSATPFGYPHCSANAFFQSDLGKTGRQILLPDDLRYKYLPSNVRVPLQYRMGENGLLLREDIVDTEYVEEIYISPRNFLFNMNKLSGERDAEQQSEENDLPPITIEKIETGTPDFVPKEAKIFEQGKVDKNRMTDLELCAIIDGQIVPRLIKGRAGASIYSLPESKRADICEALWQENGRYRSDARGLLSGKYVTQAQLRRCLGCATR